MHSINIFIYGQTYKHAHSTCKRHKKDEESCSVSIPAPQAPSAAVSSRCGLCSRGHAQSCTGFDVLFSICQEKQAAGNTVTRGCKRTPLIAFY